jgi:hypothetical protein
MLAFAPTGEQTMSQREVDQFLTEARMAPTNKSPRVLGINQITIMRAKQNGYPVDMHHPTMEMRQAFKEEEEMALASLGYQRNYIAKEYPKALFRRNMSPRFEPQFDPATQIQLNHDFVEEKVCRSEDQEKALRAMKPKPGQSAWFDKITDLPPLDDSLAEDPKVTIARLEGQVAGLQQEVSKTAKSKKSE